MCWSCVVDAGGDAINPDPYKDLIDRIAAWYRNGHPTGGPLHVLLDDQNLEDDFLNPTYLDPAHKYCTTAPPCHYTDRERLTIKDHGCADEMKGLLADLRNLSEAERNVVAYCGAERFYDETSNMHAGTCPHGVY